jgi:hypothetical protein
MGRILSRLEFFWHLFPVHKLECHPGWKGKPLVGGAVSMNKEARHRIKINQMDYAVLTLYEESMLAFQPE